MEVLLELIRETPATKDSLSKLVETVGGKDVVEQRIVRWTRIDWGTVVESCQSKAEVVFQGVVERGRKEKNEVMDDAMKLHVRKMAFREACARQIWAIFVAMEQQQPESEPSSGREPASPFAKGGRFNQIPSESIAMLLKQGWAPIPKFMNMREWQPLCVLDVERAEKTSSLHVDEGSSSSSRLLQLSPEQHRLYFPALISIAELLAALPRELNLKLSSRYAEVQSEVWVWNHSFRLPRPTSKQTKQRILAGYVFSRVDDNVILNYETSSTTLRCNSVILLNLPPPLFSSTFTLSHPKVWMLCVTFEAD